MHAAESTSDSPRPRTVKCVFKHAFPGLLPTGLAVGLAPHGRRYGWITSRFAPAAGWRQWVPRLRAWSRHAVRRGRIEQRKTIEARADGCVGGLTFPRSLQGIPQSATVLAP